MGTAFSNALSGLQANSQAIDVVSANLANMNTYGYKAEQVSFEELVSQSLAGTNGTNLVGGSVNAATNESLSQGSITTTSQPYDAAIQGNGYFVLQTSAGQQAFTRAGNFTVNATGQLLTQSGDNVQGWNGVAGVVNTNSAATNITLPVSGLSAPIASTAFTLGLNLDASAVKGTPAATFSSPIQVVDSLGDTHALTVTYTETAPGSWGYAITIPPGDLKSSSTTALATGTLTFDSSGNLTAPTAKTSPVVVSIAGLADGAATLKLNWNLYDTDGKAQITQYDQISSNLSSSQNGQQVGQVTGLSIGVNGAVTASYSNGTNVAVAQLAVGSVLNPGSMQDLGNNTFGVTSATALPAIGVPGTGSRGSVTGGALESSTVDIATEFTNLLVYERGYQANSKVVTTEDQVIQTTLGLIPA
jgi:flagellar hook protein FlgE